MVRIMQQDMSFFDLRKKQLLIKSVDNDSSKAAEKLVHVPRSFFWATTRIASHAIILYGYEPRLLYMVLLPTPFMGVVFFFLFKFMFKMNQKARKHGESA